ncbi:cutinase family protein [Tomitella gaofuii]|uniref:cutinase family protein n=1 Tax=Tomitella gaofuii TaxID=2760083 RepID=UPI0015FC2C98|nr:cutinase family protein [Tomitella gaofuii]
MQGTGESSSDAPTHFDTGMLSNVYKPAMVQTAAAGDAMQRAYVPYPASFGGFTPGGDQSYATSVQKGLRNVQDEAQRIAEKCPETVFVAAGYSQGAHAMSMFAAKVGQGEGVIPPEKLAAVALFGSPTRAAGAPIFPGAGDQTRPQPLPGIEDAAVAQLPALPAVTPDGQGIGPAADVAFDYGKLTGRVASFCEEGDLACDAPEGAPVVRLVAEIAGRTEIGGDPIKALNALGQALAETAYGASVDFINEDVQVGPQKTLASLSLDQDASISQRLAEAADPRTTLPGPEEAMQALVKLGGVAVHAVTAIAKDVLTPANIGAIAAAGLANPAAGLAALGGIVGASALKLVAPMTSSGFIDDVFNLVTNEVEDNAQLLDLSMTSQYFDTICRHTAYASTAATAGGLSPTDWTARWFAAVTEDVENSEEGK